MIIVIPNERPISWNQLYSGRHWSFRKQEADRVHQLVFAHIPQSMSIFEYPVEIVFRAYFKNRPLDPDNICVKLYIDGLKGRMIKDDTGEYVHSVKIMSLIDNVNPRVEIELK